MTYKNMAYDHPAYLAVQQFQILGTGTLAGGVCLPSMPAAAGGLSNKFAVFTNMLLKSLTLSATTIGTSTVGTGTLVTPYILRITNNGTSAVSNLTGTYGMSVVAVLPTGTAALTTSAYLVQAVCTGIVGTSGASVSAAGVNNWSLVNNAIPLQAGDFVQVQKSGDATEVVAPMIECTIQPLANVTLAG